MPAHENYCIIVTACPVQCSAESQPLCMVTDIDTPGKLVSPKVRFVNSSQVQVIWSRPYKRAGPLNYFQISSSVGGIQNTMDFVE